MDKARFVSIVAWPPHLTTYLLLHCRAPGQAEVWQLAAGLWTRKGFPWPRMSHTEALTAGMKRWKKDWYATQLHPVAHSRVWIALPDLEAAL